MITYAGGGVSEKLKKWLRNTWTAPYPLCPNSSLEVKRQKNHFLGLLRVLLTQYYLFWGSRWFLSIEYAEGTNSKHSSGLLHLFNLANTSPLNLTFFQQKNICTPWLILIHGYTCDYFGKYFRIFKRLLVFSFQNIAWFFVLQVYVKKMDF